MPLKHNTKLLHEHFPCLACLEGHVSMRAAQNVIFLHECFYENLREALNVCCHILRCHPPKKYVNNK